MEAIAVNAFYCIFLIYDLEFDWLHDLLLKSFTFGSQLFSNTSNSLLLENKDTTVTYKSFLSSYHLV